MPETMDNGQAKVMDFINRMNSINKAKQFENNRLNSVDVKLRKLKAEKDNANSVCIDTILGKIYKDALPFEDPDKNCSDADAAKAMHDFIADRCDKGTEYYVKEGLRKSKSPVLKQLLEEVQKVTKGFYAEKAKDIGKISIEDLNYRVTDDSDKLTEIGKDLEFEDLSEVIQNNVATALQAEKDRADREAEYSKKLEDELANNMEIKDEAALEAAINKEMKRFTPEVYQPSLFEAIMVKNTRDFMESGNEGLGPVHETIHEFTKWNIVKALKLESFSVDDVRKLANKYVNA